MFSNIIFFILGSIVTLLVVLIILSRVTIDGELWVDDKKEILQVVFNSKEKLANGLKKSSVGLKVVHKSIDWQIPQ